MEKVNKFLLMIIAMVAIMITAVGIDKGLEQYEVRQWEKERVERYEQARADVARVQMTISELSQDQESIAAFIEENREFFDETAQDPELARTQEEEKEQDISGAVSGNVPQDISGNLPDSISGNLWSGTISVSANTLKEKQKIRGSYMETQMQNELDQKILADSVYDFSDVSIACLGDSITQASNLENMENYKQYAYPTVLKELLNAESVTNLGIGGSSIGRYWDQAFVDRYREIPADTDLILVMGGTNDGFCLSSEELGTLEERKAGTFIGDLDELMRGLKENYPDATVVFATPLPNVLHDILRKERAYLLPQVTVVNVIKQLAAEHEIPVIDLYNSNILDTHDAAVIYNYMPDGVHCNPDGYRILAEHFAAELIQLYGEKEENQI